MRKSHIVASMMTFLGLAAVMGLHVFAGCVLAISIVASYGISARLLLGRHVGRNVAATIASTTLAMAAIAGGIGLVSLWAVVLQYPFLSSLSLWAAIFGGSATWALLATWLEEQGYGLRTLRAIHPREAATPN